MQEKFKNLILKFYGTKYPQGYTTKELLELIEIFELEETSFWKALRGCTGMLIGEDFITYKIDVYHAVICALENRELKNTEWD